MAKKSSIEKQKRRQAMVHRYSEKRMTLKKKILNMKLSDEERNEAHLALNKMPRNSSKVRLRNRCVLTGRCRGYLRKFPLSRLCFRELASSGMIPGIFKASW